MTSAPEVLVLIREDAAASLHPDLYGSGSASDRVVRLAEALSAGPPAAALGPHRFVVRSQPPATLALIGDFDESDRDRLSALEHTVRAELPTALPVSYGAAAEAARRLVERLVDRIGADRLRHGRLRAVPRGGFVVLGMVAAFLGTRNEDQAGSLIVLDDCAISGARFRRYLAGQGKENEIVFAPLYSTRELRHAIEAAEPAVLCVSGEDLTDNAPDRLGSGYAAWQQRWEDRIRGTAYWVGQPEHLIFPWNEPDTSYWNSARGREEKGWTLAPPSRVMGADSPTRASVFVIPDRAGALTRHPETLWARLGERVVIANLEVGDVLTLDGSAAELWDALTTEPTVDAAADRVAARHGTDPAVVREHATRFVTKLRTRRLVL